jgi:lipooligosaccharide transport system ATP-binding protein
MSEPHPVQARGLTKRYRDFTAVDGITFHVKRGRFVGLLGPNGAGKSTTMRMLYQVTPPSEGELRLFGLEAGRDAKRIKARLGVVPQIDNLDEELNVERNLLLHARMNGVTGAAARARADAVLSLVELGERARDDVRELSGGMKRRLTLARGLMNEPELFILDEPTTGLDPHVRLSLWNVLGHLHAGGMTILMSTHYMDEAERLCDEILIMDGGKIIASGSPRELIQTHLPPTALEIRLGRDDAVALARLAAELGVEPVSAGGRATLFVADGVAALARAHAAGLPERTTFLRPTNLEDVFLELTGHSLGDA